MASVSVFRRPLAHFLAVVSLGFFSLAATPAEAQEDLLGRAMELNRRAKELAKMEGGQKALLALPLAEEALAIRMRLLGERDGYTLESMDVMGYVYWGCGEYLKARAVLEKSVALRKEITGERHEWTAIAMETLANVYREQGDYVAARPLYEQALAIRRRNLGDLDATTISNLNSYGLMLQKQGEMQVALAMHERALADSRRAFGEKHWCTGSSYNAIGLALMNGNSAQALPHLQAGLAIRREVLGESHPHTSMAYNNVGLALTRLGRFDEALANQQRALALNREHRGPKHDSVASSLQSLGALYLAKCDRMQDQEVFLSNLSLAESHLVEALAIRKATLGESHPLYVANLLLLARCCFLDGDFEKAAGTCENARRASRRHVQKILPALPESEQLRFLQADEDGWLHMALSLGYYRRADGRIAAASAGWLINGKGLAQEALAHRAAMARASSDPRQVRLQQQLSSVRQELAQLALRGPGHNPAHYEKQFPLLEEQERQLSRQLGGLQRMILRADPWVELAEVRLAMPKGAVLIEIARFRQHDFLAAGLVPPWKPARYGAWVISADGTAVHLVDLGEAAPIDAMVADFQKSLQNAAKDIENEGEADAEALLRPKLEKLAQTVLRPLEPHLKGASQCLLSPDGSLWLVPWSALPLADGRYSLEEHKISYLISSRDLVGGYSRQKGKAESSLLVGDPDFSLRNAVSEVASNLRSAPAGGISTDWSPLPGTKKELEDVLPKLSSYLQAKPQVFTREQARERVIKTARQPRVAILATHGFFLPDQQQGSGGSVRLENPLLRCGLVFSGANVRKDLPPSAEDGILTGLEIVGADLRGTELVVLSACETGIGQIQSGQGVAGLRQAFQLAGAESVVASLWRVPDLDTASLMGKFWEQLASGDDRAEALRKAQLAVLAEHRQASKSTHPFFWAAFTLTGRTTPRPSTGADEPEVPVVSQVEITAGSAQVMDGAKTIATVRQGQRFKLLEIQGDWYAIELPGSDGKAGVRGWVSDKAVRFVE